MGVTTNPLLGALAEMVERSGWALQGVFGSTAAEVFTYTVGMTERGLPELWLGSLDPNQGGAILNDLGRLHVAREGGLQPGEPIDAEWSIAFRLRGPVDPRDGEVFACFGMYGEEAVSLMQVLWADGAGRYPDEEGYAHDVFPQRLVALVGA